MTSLLEISNLVRKVDVGNGQEIEVSGVSGEGLIDLMSRFPEIAKAMSGVQIDRDAFIKKAPDAVGAIIAAGIGKPGVKEEEAAARKLGLGIQVDLIDAILQATFPKGVGPFVEKLKEMGILQEEADKPEQQSVSDPQVQSSPDSSSSSSSTGTPNP
jgi:hypothetical protein